MTDKHAGHSQFMSYKDAGVNINKADQLVSSIKHIAARTKRPGVQGGIGSFGALFAIPEHYRQPLLVSGTDGVGTKLKLATALNQHQGIGIDLVAMCVNDILTLGAEPLFFLDYYATGQLNIEQATTIMDSIGKGCQLANAALIGGETAEMPGVYQHSEYDLAGFCVGVVEKDKLIDGSLVKNGDALIALASSGPHANGYSLIRRVIDQNGKNYDEEIAGSTLNELLMTPTRIYVKPILEINKHYKIHAMAHITGGGLIDNLPRTLPDYHHACINSQSWQWPALFTWLSQKGPIDYHEMLRTFNLGIGMVICVDQADAQSIVNSLNSAGEQAWQLGHVIKNETSQPSVIIENS